MSAPIDITVRMSTGTYIASAGAGLTKVRACNTAGPSNAAKSLGMKVFGSLFDRAELLGDGAKYGATKWRLYGKQSPECERCHGDGADPWCDYLLPCPLCQGEQTP